MKRAIRQLIALAAVLAALPAATAVAGPIDIIRDCVDDERLQGDYSDAQLQNALRTLRGDADEYSNCRSIIGAAIGGGSQGGGSQGVGSKADGGGGRGGADLDGDGEVTPAERRKWREQRERDRERERRQVAAIGDGFGAIGADGDRGGIAADGTSSGGGVPLPAILALVALTLAAIAGGTWYAGQRNPAVANALRRVSSLVDRY